MTKAQAVEIVGVLFASFPSAALDRKNVEAYAAGLGDLDADKCGRAVQRLIRKSKFLPSIAEIREMCEPPTPAAPYHRLWKAPTELDTKTPTPPRPTPAPALQRAPLPPVISMLPAPPSPRPAAERRKWTPEELDAELANRGSK